MTHEDIEEGDLVQVKESVWARSERVFEVLGTHNDELERYATLESLDGEVKKAEYMVKNLLRLTGEKLDSEEEEMAKEIINKLAAMQEKARKESGTTDYYKGFFDGKSAGLKEAIDAVESQLKW